MGNNEALLAAIKEALKQYSPEKLAAAKNELEEEYFEEEEETLEEEELTAFVTNLKPEEITNELIRRFKPKFTLEHIYCILAKLQIERYSDVISELPLSLFNELYSTLSDKKRTEDYSALSEEQRTAAITCIENINSKIDSAFTQETRDTIAASINPKVIPVYYEVDDICEFTPQRIKVFTKEQCRAFSIEQLLALKKSQLTEPTNLSNEIQRRYKQRIIIAFFSLGLSFLFPSFRRTFSKLRKRNIRIKEIKQQAVSAVPPTIPQNTLNQPLLEAPVITCIPTQVSDKPTPPLASNTQILSTNPF